jgi:hypothetical protein
MLKVDDSTPPTVDITVEVLQVWLGWTIHRTLSGFSAGKLTQGGEGSGGQAAAV